MKKAHFFLIAALLTSSQAFAEGLYVSGSVGYSDASGEIFNDGENGAGNPKIGIDSDVRYGIALGYELLPSFNLELEYSMASYSTDPGLQSGSDTRALDDFSIKADVDIDLLTLNASYGFENSSVFTPYIEAGLGTSFYDVDGDLFVGSFMGTDGGGFLPATFNYKGDGSEFVYFVGAGVEWEITEKIDLTLAYRYSDLGQVSTDYDINGDRLQADLKTSDLKLGVKFNF